MIYDINTTNKSFLKAASTLKKMGVKNNKFMLSLYDKSLIGVDPFSDNLTDKQKIAIFREVSLNKWYYIREVVRIPVDGVIKGIPYKLNLGNLTLSYLKSKNKNQIVILPRQHGKTMGEIIDDSWILLFSGTNTNIIYSNKEFKDSKKNLKLFKDIKERLPKFLIQFVSSHKDKDNEEYKLVHNRNNTLKAMAAANSDDAADKLGRGMTTSNIYFDEFAFLARNKIIFEAALPAWSTASENAKANGVPYGITITTTPNNVDTKQGAYAKMMIEKAAKWIPICFDMNDRELDEFILKNSGNNFIFVQYSYLELGRTNEWLEVQIRNFQNDLAKVKRELLLDWPKSTDFSLFSEEQLELISQHTKQAQMTLTINGYVFDFYETPDLNMNYILSCDIAGGLSQDNTVITVIAPDDFRIVGDFRNNKIDTDSTKNLILTAMRNYFINSILIVERNSYGLNIIQTLMKDPDIESRMVREERVSLGEKSQKDGFVVKRRTKNYTYGIDTNVKTRRLMFELLPEIIETDYDKLVSPRLYEDIAGLERKPNGKIEHSNTSHDDNLMSYLIFRYALHYGTSLKERFKINPIPSERNIRNSSSGSDMARIERILRETQSNQALAVYNNQIYDYLADQEKKIGERNSQINAFEKIANFNKD